MNYVGTATKLATMLNDVCHELGVAAMCMGDEIKFYGPSTVVDDLTKSMQELGYENCGDLRTEEIGVSVTFKRKDNDIKEEQ